MPQVIESFLEFERRQGCQWIIAQSTIGIRTGSTVQRIIFENGATSNGDYNHSDPPADSRQRLALQREFVQAALKQTEDEWQRFHRFCLQQAQLHADPLTAASCPGPPADAPERLQAGKSRIEALRQRLAEVDEQLKDPAAEQRRKHQEQAEATRQAAAQETLRQLQELTL